MTNLGVLYENGFGVKLDEEEAKKWYRKAGQAGGIAPESKQIDLPIAQVKTRANTGNAAAQYRLGQLYFEGSGVPQDYVLAYQWSSLAAAQGHKEAAALRDALAVKMTIGQVNEAPVFSPSLDSPNN